MGYAVTQRTQEIGIRMALGAAPGRVARVLLGEGLRPVAVGVAVGLVTAAAATTLLQSMVYGVERLEPGVYLLAVFGILAIAAVASLFPLLRAVRMPPAAALRQE